MVNKKAELKNFLSGITEDAITATDVEETDVELKGNMDPEETTCEECGEPVLAHVMPGYMKYVCENCGHVGTY